MNWTPQQLDDYNRRMWPKEKPLPTVENPQPLMMVTSEKRIDFFMEFEPPEVTAQQKGERVVVPKDYPISRAFVHHYVKPEVEKAQQEIARHLLPFRPAAPFEGPLRLIQEWRWSWRASEPKKNRQAGWRWRDTQPDFDNLSKTLADQMRQVGFFHNDGQVADGRITTQWNDRPGIRITLEQLDQP